MDLLNDVITNDCKEFFLDNGYRPGADEVVHGANVADLLDQLVPAAAKLKPEHQTPNILDLRDDVAAGVDARMGARSEWSGNRTNSQNMTTVLLVWLWFTRQTHSIHRAILMHDALGDKKNIMIEESMRSIHHGMAAFLIASLVLGPCCKKESIGESLENIEFLPIDKMAVVIPTVQLICNEADPYEVLKDKSWVDIYKRHKNHNWYKNLSGKGAKSIWSEEKVLEYIDEDMDDTKLIEICSGLRFEVALVFTYIRRDFKFTTNTANLHITDDQKEMLMNGRVPNIENPGQFLDVLYRKKEKSTPRAKRIRTA